MYLQRFGRILHHNTDQVEVVGGQSAPKFGGGVFLEPAYILLVGRATTMVNGERLPYRTTAIQAAHDYLTTNCTNLRSEEHTSELQSLAYLVCRLLLEKKKKKIQADRH